MTAKLSDQQKIDLVKDYQTGEFTLVKLSEKYLISRQAISRLLKHRNIEVRRGKSDKNINR